MAGPAYTTEAVVLRSMRLGEADRVLHLYTEAHGRVGAVAKGVRKTMSRFGARLEPLSLAFQLKLLWVAGYLPHVTACAECGAEREPLVGYSPRAGGAVCERCASATEALALAPDGSAGIEALLAQPLASAVGLGLSERAQRDALRVITASYEYHGGFRLRTLSA